MDHSVVSWAKPGILKRGVGLAAMLLAVGVTAGCIQNTRENVFDAAAGRSLDDKSNAAIAALALGDLPRAEGSAEEALKAYHDDPYALLVLASVYERTGRPVLARDTYLQLYNLPIDRPIASSLWANGQQTSVQAIASARLLALPKAPPTILPPPTHAELAARGPAGPEGEQARSAILVKLHVGGLITDAEYNDRRSAVEHGGARHLGPTPSYEEISSRLQELRRSLDAHELTVEQFTSERVAILNGLVQLYHDVPAPAPSAMTSGAPKASSMSAPAPVRVAPSSAQQSAASSSSSSMNNPAATLKSVRSGAQVVADPSADPSMQGN